MNQKNIFIVEDDPDICELISIILTEEKYKVKTFLDSNKVEGEIKKLKPSLIIMDLWMSGISGDILTKKLKSQKTTKSIPIILISANNSLEKLACQAKADAFLPKPFNIKDLLSVVRRFV